MLNQSHLSAIRGRTHRFSSNAQGGVRRIAIKLGIPRQQFANISIVLVLSEAEPSGPRPRPQIGAYFEDEDDHGNTLA